MRKILFILAAVLLGSIGLHASNTITYKSSERLVIADRLEVGATTFGPAITSHTFSNGTGTITCNGEITKIGSNAFSFNNSYCMTSIVIPNSVKTVENWAFDGCSGLKTIEFPPSVTSIGVYAFFNCSGLTSIEIPNSITSIGEYAFQYCSSLTSVTVNWTDAQSIVSIDNSVFEEIAYKKGPSGAKLYVPEGTSNLYKQANGWKDFGSIIDLNNCKITYTASKVLLPGYHGNLAVGATTFGPAITSHEFSNGTGTITCNGEIAKIGEEAFWDCTIMNTITIPASVTTIENLAFRFCSSLTSFTIPNHVTWIGASTFLYCTSLKTVYCYALTPPKLDTDVFKGVPKESLSVYVLDVEKYQAAWKQLPASCFKSVAIPAEVDGIKYELFVENTRYKARVIAKDGGYTQSTITVPEKISYMGYTFAVTEIGQSAFKNCIDLTSVTLPKSVTTIGMDAFWQCSNLTSVTIPNSVTEIGQSAFFETGLTSVTIPASVKEIGTWAFKNCTKLNELNIIDRKDPINIGTYAFENMAVTEVSIPDWMTVIPEGLFYANSNLEGIYLHERVKEFKYRPFGKCNNLKYIISMPTTPPEQDRDAFEEFNGTAYVYVTSVDAKTKYENAPKWNLHNFVFFLDSITYRKISNTDVEVASAYPIGGRISIPAVVTLKDTLYNVAGIGSGAIKDQTELQHLILPPTMKYIGDNALEGCTNLKNVKLPIELQTIGSSAFYGCSALDSIAIPEGVQSIGKSAFKGCSKLTRVSLPAGLKNIPDECFRQCPLGQEIIIPEGVETIGEYAFEGNSETRMDAESITLPSTLKEINQGAFFLHDGLKGVTCLATAPPTLKGQAFAEYQYQKYKEEHITVYVPNRDVVAAYRDDKNQWGSDIYQFKFSDLMAEANKEYLHTLAGNNDTAKVIANAYCDSIDNRATTTQQVQDYTNTAAMMMDKYVFPDYKKRLCDALDSIAAAVLDAQPIADEYKPRIMDTHFRGEAENLFAEGCAKIDALKQLQDLKRTCGNALRDMAQDNKNAKLMADTYAELIDGAATQAEVYQLYEEGKKRVAQILFLEEYWTELPDGCRVLGGFIEE